jgi:hypothetical protein
MDRKEETACFVQVAFFVPAVCGSRATSCIKAQSRPKMIHMVIVT